ncbi:expressed unknown protein [Seminavis robusta]|uniref:Uncharacterized protein n=1 Tax=Seminavis robusta TaxID=568900 RepID=A0A9N8HXI4_9STRA|nr:expressed unknown protein [Seminavis robusta]|eukprot:Sro2506_g329690.1 n/a (202) ;mRNA; r:12804-13409
MLRPTLGAMAAAALQSRTKSGRSVDSFSATRVVVPRNLQSNPPIAAVPITTQPPDFPIDIRPILNFFGGPNSDNWCRLSDYAGDYSVVCCGGCHTLQNTGFRILNVDRRAIATTTTATSPPSECLGRFRGAPILGSFATSTKRSNREAVPTNSVTRTSTISLPPINPESTFIYRRNWVTRRVLYAPSPLSAGSQDVDYDLL